MTVMDTMEQRFSGFDNQNTFYKHNKAGTVDEFDRLYDEAVEKVRSKLLGKQVPLHIGGKDITTDDWLDWRSPADQDLVVVKFPKSTKEHAKQAIAAANQGFQDWSHTPWQERANILRQTAEHYVRDFYELCAIMTFESGKTRYEASIDVDEAIDFLRFYALMMEEMNGYEMQMDQPVPNEHCRSVMRPYGTFGVICPFNFPNAITTGMTAAALVTGNTAIMKPSMKGVLSGWKCSQLMYEAGVPGSALQFLVGPDDEVAVELTSNTDVAGIVFTGSKNVGFKVQQTFAETDPAKPVITEMGGKNPIIVTAKADMDKAVEGVFRSAFGFQGQKCSAGSRILVDKSIKDEFVERLKKRTDEAVVAHPWKKEAFMGPIIEESKHEWFLDWVKKVQDAGGTIVSGGESIKSDELNGWYVRPTFGTGVERDHPVFTTELFVPFTMVWAAEDLDDAIDAANSVEYGLTAGIFTEDKDEAERFFARIKAGVTYLNRRAGGSTAAVVNGQSFGGWKHSGSTGVGAGGRYYLQQFMREQSQTRVVED